MYKFFLYFRKIIICLTILVLASISIFINSSKAKNSDSGININESTIIEIPSENIKNIPIIGYKLIYQLYNASLVDFLNDKIKELKQNLQEVGIKEKNIVIIYLNYNGNPKSKLHIPTYKDIKLDPNIDFSKYITDEQVSLDLTQLLQSYSLPFLTAKRNIIIGTLVDNTILFKGNDYLKVIPVNFTNTKAINLFKLNSKPNETEENNNQTTLSYTYEEIIQYRSSMISYMNLGSFKNTKFIGMMEYFDKIHNAYTFFALPGNLHDFLHPINN